MVFIEGAPLHSFSHDTCCLNKYTSLVVFPPTCINAKRAFADLPGLPPSGSLVVLLQETFDSNLKRNDSISDLKAFRCRLEHAQTELRRR